MDLSFEYNNKLYLSRNFYEEEMQIRFGKTKLRWYQIVFYELFPISTSYLDYKAYKKYLKWRNNEL